MSDVYPYPGDDPNALSGLSYSVELANGFVTRMSTGLGKTRSELQSAWTGNASQLAQADMAKLTAAFPTMGTKLTSAKTAVDTYRTAVVSIRGQVDELRAQHAKLAAALQSEQESYGRAGRFVEANADPDTSSAEIAKQTAEVRAGIAQQETKTKNQLAALDQQYQALVTRSNTAASTCSVALQSASTQYSYQGSTPTTQGVAQAFGLSDLQVAHYQAAVTAGKQAAALGKELANPKPNDPDYRKKVAELLKLTNQYNGDPVFSTTLYQTLGQDAALKLPMELGYHDGNLDPQAVGQLQRNLGADLAAATQYYGDAAGNKSGVPQLSDDWVRNLMGRAKNQLGPLTSANDFNADFPTFGGQGLGILLHTGQYNAKFLDDSGNAIRQLDGLKVFGDGSVYDAPSAAEARFWFGGDGSANDDSGIDPMVGWAQAGIHNPTAERHALAGDNDLLNYLLNDRDWPYGSAVAGGSDPNANADFDGKFNHGLSLFGTSLDKATGVGAVDPTSRTLFSNIVHDLGDDTKNHRITDGDFATHDWIPPELRPAIGDIAVKNIADVHTSLAGEGGSLFDDHNGVRDLSRVLADVGKDPTARVNISHAEDGWVTNVLGHGLPKVDGDHYDPETDMRAYGKVYALLAHGGNSHTDAVTMAADAAHNARVDEIAEYATYGADKVAGSIPVVGELVTTFGVDKLSSLITDSLHVDHTQEAYVHDANTDFAERDRAEGVVRTAVLQSIDPTLLARARPDDFPNGVVPTDWAHMSGPQRAAFDSYLDESGHASLKTTVSDFGEAWQSEYASDKVVDIR